MSDKEEIVFCKGGGCTAKLGPGILARVLEKIPKTRDENLMIGYDSSDDAAVYKLTDDLAVVQTLDFFPPIADDPYTFGQIAATNALSDIYAMGGDPKLALNIMCVPEDMPKDTVHQILRGGYEKVYEAGALITGGHSILDDEPKYGLAVTGFVHPDRVLTNSGARPGDVLLLTKPIGIGVLTTAQKAEMLSAEGRALAEELMTTLNKSARDAMVKYRVHACTDVTGFSLLGHSYEMCGESGLTVIIDSSRVPLLPGADNYASMGLVPAVAYQNMKHLKDKVALPKDLPSHVHDLLFDPQTSGGLLYSVASQEAGRIMEALQKACQTPAVIGHVEGPSSHPVMVI